MRALFVVSLHIFLLSPGCDSSSSRATSAWFNHPRRAGASVLLEDEERGAVGYSLSLSLAASVVNKRRRVEEEESVARIYRRQCRCRILTRTLAEIGGGGKERRKRKQQRRNWDGRERELSKFSRNVSERRLMIHQWKIRPSCQARATLMISVYSREGGKEGAGTTESSTST